MKLIKMLEEKNVDLTKLFSIHEEACFIIETDIGGDDIIFYMQDNNGKRKELFRADLEELKLFSEQIKAFTDFLESEIKLDKREFNNDND